MSRLTVYYGRILVEDKNPGQAELSTTFEPVDPIKDCLEGATSIERYRHEWVIGNLKFDADATLATGRLGYPDREQRTQEDYDAEHQAFVETEIELPHAVSAAFVLDYRSGSIAFEEHDRIGPTGFVKHLAALLKQAGGSRYEFRGELIRIADNYRDFVRRVDRISQVAFDVFPTNPRDRPIFRPLDEGMKAMNANRERFVAENKEEGLQLRPPESRDETTDNPAIMGIEMTEEGYGKGYRIDAEMDGRPVRYDSTSGGGLLRDVLEDVPESPEIRLDLLMVQLTERAPGLAESSEQGVQPLDATEEVNAEADEKPETDDLGSV